MNGFHQNPLEHNRKENLFLKDRRPQASRQVRQAAWINMPMVNPNKSQIPFSQFEAGKTSVMLCTETENHHQHLSAAEQHFQLSKAKL
jgi:hypothetical protein